MNRRCVVVTIGLCACEGPFVPPTPPGPPPPAVAAVQVTPDSATIIAGDTLRVVVTFAPGAARISASVEGRADTVPVVIAPVRFTAVALGAVHSCAPANNGHIYCWGDNTAGQIGTGTGTLIETAPRPAATGARFARASAGALHTCALTNDGTAY